MKLVLDFPIIASITFECKPTKMNAKTYTLDSHAYRQTYNQLTAAKRGEIFVFNTPFSMPRSDFAEFELYPEACNLKTSANVFPKTHYFKFTFNGHYDENDFYVNDNPIEKPLLIFPEVILRYGTNYSDAVDNMVNIKTLNMELLKPPQILR